MGYPIQTYICVVDGYRRPTRKRNTAGRYRVGAKNEKEAVRILQKQIKFGSVRVLGPAEAGCRMRYKQCMIEHIDRTLSPIRSAIDPI